MATINVKLVRLLQLLLIHLALRLEGDDELSALAYLALHLDAAPTRYDDLLADAETKAYSLLVLCLGLLEFAEVLE